MEENTSFDQTDELLVKYLTGMADDTERNDALSWIRQNNENRRYFDELKDVYEAAKVTQSPNSYNTDLSWEKVKSMHYKNLAVTLQEERRNSKRIFIRELVKYAAIIVLVSTLGVLGYRYLGHDPKPLSADIWNHIEAPFGSRARLTLADGTKVWLNAGSQLRYSSGFANHNREVFLEGEAYFDVTPNKDLRFIVKTSHLDIKVFGTEFNVKAYPDEDIIQTTLVKGSVTLEGDIIAKTGRRVVYLKPNQTATYFIHERITVKNETPGKDPAMKKVTGKENMEILPDVNPVFYTSWKDSRWMIEGETLAGLAKMLERRFNVKIIFKSNQLQHYKFTGTLKDETLEQVLNLMKLSAPIDFQIRNNDVFLDENKSFKNSYDELLINR